MIQPLGHSRRFLSQALGLVDFCLQYTYNPKNKQNLRNVTSVEFVLEIWKGMNLKKKIPKNQMDFRKKKMRVFAGQFLPYKTGN